MHGRDTGQKGWKETQQREGFKELCFARKKTRFRTAVRSFLLYVCIYLERGNFRRHCWKLIILFYYGFWQWGSGHLVWQQVPLQDCVFAYERLRLEPKQLHSKGFWETKGRQALLWLQRSLLLLAFSAVLSKWGVVLAPWARHLGQGL